MTDQFISAPTLEGLRNHRAEILQIAQRYGVSNVRVFGSVARGEAKSGSDVDLLVDFPAHFSLLDLSELTQELQAVLGFPVQVTSASHLIEEMRPSILRDAQLL